MFEEVVLKKSLSALLFLALPGCAVTTIPSVLQKASTVGWPSMK